MLESVTELEANYEWCNHKLEKARQELAFLKGDLSKAQEEVR